MTLIKTKRQYKKEFLYAFLTFALIAGIAITSWLLFDNFKDKTWNEIKIIIVGSIVSYLSYLQLGYRLVLDIVLYRKKFKQANSPNETTLIQVPSKYTPKGVKVSQNALKCEIYIEKKIGDSFVRVSDKEIVVVYGKTFANMDDYEKSITYTLNEIKEHIWKKSSVGK